MGNATGGKLSEEQVRSYFDQFQQSVSQTQYGETLGPILNGLGKEEVRSNVATSAAQMTPDQKGGLVETLLGAFGSSGGGLSSLLGQLGINQNVANNPQSASPDEVGKLAAHTKEAQPGIFQQAMSIYSKNPTLVKTLGVAVLTQLASHLTSHKK